ncbi:hypothetical protein CMU40_07900 [Elizabethkingia anophelis]|uniref:DUF4280 domain-containing protein n=1 Tax=Elizabethkingia anophelis TaxID=1117645 RepID=UPI0021A461AA|nr:DUF4280 domain-containing protein [Elizabethkingia anophelis]MCT3825919.1 DUF4280 domain-containing protein [Elizabethkingia anophelis]MCT3836655.1 DUF4280 domain-containing protein [Elizabethkingia anophelis]MCT3840322.1 DUF4280 domain-containing protein [Elizabethkingia anophelis]MCT3847485.1 DUF4280 domain-containing protein [Elizabethkingia anophelis]
MSEKHLVCQGALCMCNFGTAPDKLKVKTQSKRYINDKDGADKLMATHMDIGKTFEKNTFGSCSKMNNNPCQVTVTEWSGFYDKITLEDNKGKALLEDSKATCPIGSKDCIKIVNHGQTAEISSQSVENADQEVLAELFPFVPLSSEEDKILNIQN